jgi:hypothetical protein
MPTCFGSKKMIMILDCLTPFFPLKLLINSRSCLYVHGFINSYIHTNRLLVLNSTVHHHYTRQSDNLHLFRNDSIRNGRKWSTIGYYDKNFISEHNWLLWWKFCAYSEIRGLDRIGFKVGLKNCFLKSMSLRYK